MLLLTISRHKRTLHSKKYGADLVRFTHSENSAVHSSTKIDGNNILNVGFTMLKNVKIYRLKNNKIK